MNLKKLYAEQKHSIYEIQKYVGVSHYTLYHYYGNATKIKRIPYDILKKIAEFEEIDEEELLKKMIEYAEKINK